MATTEKFDVIESYKWADEDKVVKIYVDLEGIDAHPRDKLDIKFEAKKVEIKVTDFKGRSLRLSLADLNEEIDPATSTMRLTPKRIIVTLAKKEPKKWWDLQKKPEAKWSPEDS